MCMTSRTDDGFSLMKPHGWVMLWKAGRQEYNVIYCDAHRAAVFYSASLLSVSFWIEQFCLNP